MNWKEFFKLEKRKILISILLIGIAAFFTFTPLVPYIIFPFYFAMILFYSIPIYFTVIIFILISYPFGCYVAKNKKWFKGIVLYLIAFVVISGTITFAIFGYNKVFGRSCKTDFDCKFICGARAVNDRFIYLKDPFMIIDCMASVAICKDNKCKALPDEVTEAEDCERAKQKRPEVAEMCYFKLARKINDIGLCDKITQTSLKERCIED